MSKPIARPIFPAPPPVESFLVDMYTPIAGETDTFHSENLQVEDALAVFTDEAKALLCRATLPPGWEVGRMEREELCAMLADHHAMGLSHVAIDPESGKQARLFPVFSVLVELG